MACYVPDYVICPACLTVEDIPFAVGDQCVCGCRMVAGESVSTWKRVYDLVGSLVAAAREQRRKGGTDLAVCGAIGDLLIDRREFDGHSELLKQRNQSQ